MKLQVLYPTGIGEHHAMQFRDGPVIEGLNDSMAFLRTEIDPNVWCDRPDPFGIPVKSDKGDLVAYLVFKED